MTTESMQMDGFPELVGYEVPEGFGGCKCVSSKCMNNYCACFMGRHRCTLNCNCLECANIFGIRGSDSNIQEKKAPPRSAAPVLIGLEVPDGVKGCTCRSSRCDNGKCSCRRRHYRCTSNCSCRGCINPYGTRWSCSSTEPAQGGTGGASSVPDDTTPSSNIEPEHSDHTSGMAREPPQAQAQSRGSKDFNLNQPPSPKTEPEQADGDSSTEAGQGEGGTAGASNVPDETTSAPNIGTEQADDTSGMAREPSQVEEQSRGNRGFDLNEVPPSNIEQGQADGTSSIADGPA